MERDLREVIGNSLILNSPLPPIPDPMYIYVYLFLMLKPTFRDFPKAVKFDYLFLAIFQCF